MSNHEDAREATLACLQKFADRVMADYRRRIFEAIDKAIKELEGTGNDSFIGGLEEAKTIIEKLK